MGFIFLGRTVQSMQFPLIYYNNYGLGLWLYIPSKHVH